jgi:hypothetical protein
MEATKSCCLPGVILVLVDSSREMALEKGRRLSNMARVGGQLPPKSLRFVMFTKLDTRSLC